MSGKRGSVRLQNLHTILVRSSRHQSVSSTSSSPSSALSSPSITVSSTSSRADETRNSRPPHDGSCRLTVSPAVSQFDQPVSVRLAGLAGHAKVTLQAWRRYSKRDGEVVLVSHGHYYTNHHGDLDLSRDPSLGGSYTGVSAMGLFWSMAPLPGHPQDVYCVIKDVTKPVVVNIAVFDGHITPNDDTVAMTSTKPLSVTTAERTMVAPGVRRVVIREGRLRGTLFLPAGTGEHPGVIDMYGDGGGNTEIRAALLAAHGFAAFSLAYCRFEDLPKYFYEVQLDYFEEAVNWFSSHPSVKRGGVGVVGASRGGTLTFLMAIQCRQVKAVVTINGAPFQINFDLLRQGRVFQEGIQADPSQMKSTNEIFITKDAYKVTDDNIFPVWRSDAHVLCLTGEDDQQISWHHAINLRDLYPAQRRHLIDVVVYPGAGHILDPPYSPHCRYSKMAGPKHLWGGELRAHTMAQLDAWHKTLNFLRTWLGCKH